MKVALIGPADPGIRLVARALRAHRVSSISLDMVPDPGAVPEGVTHVVGPAESARPLAALGADVTALVARDGVAPGLWLVEPAGPRPRLADPDWCAGLAPPDGSAERDLWVTVAIDRWAALTRPSPDAAPVDAPAFPASARPRLLVLGSAAAWLPDLIARDQFDIVVATDPPPPDGADAAGVCAVRIGGSTPVAPLLRRADAVLCDGSWRLYEALGFGFRPVAAGPSVCGDPRLVHAAATAAEALAVLDGPPGRWRLDYDGWRAFETFMAVALCRETVGDDAAGRAEIVRRLAAPDAPPLPRLAPPRRPWMPPIVAACREILGNPGPWLGDLGTAIERRARGLPAKSGGTPE